MSIRFAKGKARAQPPRLKDVARRERSGNGTVNHDKSGKFTAGNRAAEGKRLKAILKRHLGRDATGAGVEALYREVKNVFTALVCAVGSDAPQVQDTLA